MNEKAVYRQLALPVSVFDHIKDVQRARQAQHGERLTLNETVARIVREHKQNEEREAHAKQSQQPRPRILH